MTSGQASGAPRPGGFSRRVAPGSLASVSVEDRDGIPIASIGGEVDLSNAEDISQALTDLHNVAPGLIVDLAGVSYLDSTAIALLFDLARRLRERSQALVIVSPSKTAPRRVLEITGLDTKIAIADELGPALSLLSPTTPPEG